MIDAIGVRRTFRVTGVWFLATSALAAVAPGAWLLVDAARRADRSGVAVFLNAYAWFLSNSPGVLGMLASPVPWAEPAAEASGWSDACAPTGAAARTPAAACS